MIYIIKTYGKDKELIKIGYTDNFENRIFQYLYHNPLIETLHTVEFENDIVFESKLHKKYPSTVFREWYDISFLNIFIEEIENFKNGGFIEDKTNIYHHQFKTLVDMYLNSLNYEDSEEFNFIQRAIDMLGMGGLEKLQFNRELIEKEMSIQCLIIFINTLEQGKFYPINFVKEEIKKYFKDNCISLSSKATSLKELCNVEFYKKKIGGKAIRGLVIH